MMHPTVETTDQNHETNHETETNTTNTDDANSNHNTTQTNKPKPLQVDESSSNDNIEPNVNQTINQEGAQSPLYYVPSAILFTPHGSHAPNSLNQTMNQSLNSTLTHPRYAPSPVALGSYPRYNGVHHPSQLAAINQSINQSNQANMLYALNFPTRSSSDAAIEAIMAANNLLGSPTHRAEPYPNYLNQTMNQSHQPMMYTYQGSPVSPMNFSPLTSPMSPALSSVFGLPSPTHGVNQSMAHSMGFSFDTPHQQHQSAFTFTDMNGGRPHEVNQFNDFSQSMNQNQAFNPALGYPIDQQWLGYQQQQQQQQQQAAFGVNRQPSDFDAFGQPINHAFDPTRLNDKVAYTSGPRQHQQNNYNNLGMAGNINHPSHPLHGRLNDDQSNKRNYRNNHRQNNIYQPSLSTVPAGNNNAPAPRQTNANSPDQLIASLTVETVSGQVVRLAKTHSGSRLMQHKLETKDAAFFPVLFRELKGSIVELACDNFAHFAVEKLIAASDEEQVNELLDALAPAFNVVACQKHGSFACQSMVDACATPTQQKILSDAIQGHPNGEISLLQLCLHASGHFVVLRMLEKLESTSNALNCIDQCMCENASAIAADHHGLRVVKAYIAARPKEKVQPFYTAIIDHTLSLASTAFGNYTIQACLEVADSSTRSRIRSALRGHYATLSKQKFSSNVVEHCLKHAGADWKRVILSELCSQPGVSELLRDRYGNYVLQSAVTVASGDQLQFVIDSITPHLSSLRENVRQKWKSIIIKAQAQLAANEPEEVIQLTRSPSPVPGLPPMDMPSKVLDLTSPQATSNPASPVDEVGSITNVVRALRIEAA